MRSGELARLVEVSTDTLRHYERLKLLTTPVRTPSGYRNYSQESVRRVRLIRRALKLGFSLPELRTILRIRDSGGAPCHQVRDLAQTKLRQLDLQIKDLLTLRAALHRVLNDWDRRLKHEENGRPARLLENLPEEFGTEIPLRHVNMARRKKGT